MIRSETNSRQALERHRTMETTGAEPASKSAAMDGVYSYNDYEHKSDPPHQPLYLKDILQELSVIGPGARVLDLGCGDGNFAESISQQGYRMHGLDMSNSGIRIAKPRNCGQFKVASIYDPVAGQFEGEAFDAIYCVEVVEHLYSPLTMARRAYEALKPGGVLVVTTPYWGWLKNIVLAVTNRTDRSLTVLWEGGHIKHFSRKTLTQLMTGVGFEETRFQGAGEGWRRHLPYLWSSMLMSFRKPAA